MVAVVVAAVIYRLAAQGVPAVELTEYLAAEAVAVQVAETPVAVAVQVATLHKAAAAPAARELL